MNTKGEVEVGLQDVQNVIRPFCCRRCHKHALQANYCRMWNGASALDFLQLCRKLTNLGIRNDWKKHVIFKGGKLGGNADMISSLESKTNVELVPNSSVKSISGDGSLSQIVIADKEGNEKTLNVDGLFIENGSKINLDFVKHLVKINTKGEVEVGTAGSTSHPAIFAAGDATNMPYKQIIAACGDGASAGLSAFNYVEKLGGKPGIRSDWKKQIGDTVFHY